MRSNRHARVVVTGIGMVTPVGLDTETSWQAIVDGRSGVGPITLFDARAHPVRIAGEVRGFPRGEPEVALEETLGGRSSRFALGAAGMALADASLDPDAPDHPCTAMVVGAGQGRLPLDDYALPREALEQCRWMRAYTPQALTTRTLARRCRIRGRVAALSMASATGLEAVGLAFQAVASGEAEAAVAGGYDSLINPLDMLSLHRLGLLSQRNDDPPAASRPFDRMRDGMVISEGAVMLVLEERERALQRKARLYGEIVGLGTSLSRTDLGGVSREGYLRCMAEALAAAGLAPEQIDHLQAYANSVRDVDRTEAQAIHDVFGSHAPRVSISAVKSVTGHLTWAAGALSVACACLSMRDSVVPPILNLETPDAGIDLDWVRTARHVPVHAAMVNGFGLGGTNVSLVLRSVG